MYGFAPRGARTLCTFAVIASGRISEKYLCLELSDKKSRKAGGPQNPHALACVRLSFFPPPLLDLLFFLLLPLFLVFQAIAFPLLFCSPTLDNIVQIIHKPFCLAQAIRTMCIYDRNAFDCGHQEWGPMRTQCNKYCRKCCVRTGDESFPNQQPGLCHSCQIRRSNPRDIATDDSIHLTIRIKPSMIMEKAALRTAKGLPINPAHLPTPDNFESYIASCLKRYQQAHNLPEDTLKIADTKCTPVSGDARVTRDAYHHHSCGLTNSGCKKLQDYQMQIMLLEQQNRRRLQMARPEPDAGSTATKQPNETPTLQELKFRNYKLHDYQRQLMCEAMQAKKEQPTTSVPHQANGGTPTHSAPQDALNEQAMKKLSLKEPYDMVMWSCSGDVTYEPKSQRPTTELPQGAADASRLLKQDAPVAGVPQTHMPAGALSRPPPLPNYTMTMPASADLLRRQNAALQDYSMQLMLLEQQNRKRLMLARADQQKLAVAHGRSAQEGEQAIKTGSVSDVQVHSGDRSAPHKNDLAADYQTHFTWLEQQRGKAQLLARSSQQQPAASDAPNTQECKQIMDMDERGQSDDHTAALTDYQMQLTLLEQQVKKRFRERKPDSEQQNVAVSATPNAEQSKQITEMGVAPGAPKDTHNKGNVSVTNDVDPAQPGVSVVRQDANGVKWIAFEHSREGVKMEYTIRCDTDSVNLDDLSPEFRTDNCAYPGACGPIEEYKGKRLIYEMECNKLGWALAHLNPCLRGKHGLIKRAVDSWRTSNQLVVRSDDDDEWDEEDAAMWSTDEFDEWSNCDAEELEL
jgi:hypothetical protein